MADFTTTSRELSLQEMLADPIVQTVMSRDGVTKEDLTSLLGTLRERMASKQMEEHEFDRREVGSSAFQE